MTQEQELEQLLIKKTWEWKLVWEWVKPQHYKAGNFFLHMAPTTDRSRPYEWYLSYYGRYLPGTYNRLGELLSTDLAEKGMAEAIADVEAL